MDESSILRRRGLQVRTGHIPIHSLTFKVAAGLCSVWWLLAGRMRDGICTLAVCVLYIAMSTLVILCVLQLWDFAISIVPMLKSDFCIIHAKEANSDKLYHYLFFYILPIAFIMLQSNLLNSYFEKCRRTNFYVASWMICLFLFFIYFLLFCHTDNN